MNARRKRLKRQKRRIKRREQIRLKQLTEQKEYLVWAATPMGQMSIDLNRVLYGSGGDTPFSFRPATPSK